MLRSTCFVLLPIALVTACSGGSDTTKDSGADDVSNGGDSANDGQNTAPPTVTSNVPLSSATGESTTTLVSATFSEDMAPLSIANATFTLTQGGNAVSGKVSYFDKTATFAPASELTLATVYTATVTTGATDVAGHALATPYTWSFTTDTTAPIGPAPVLLGTSGNFAILAKSAVSTVPTSAITGDVGLSPAAASFITGFALTRAGTKWTSPQVVGSVFAADNDPPTPTNLTTAVLDMQNAYTDAAGRPTPAFLDLGAGAIGGLTLAPGLYRWNSTVTIPTDVTIAGAHNDRSIFQITGDLKMSAAKHMTLSGGAQSKNIVWQIAGQVDFGTTSHAEGIVLSKTAITLETGASINGRLLAQTAVSLASNAVTAPAQ